MILSVLGGHGVWGSYCTDGSRVGHPEACRSGGELRTNWILDQSSIRSRSTLLHRPVYDLCMQCLLALALLPTRSAIPPHPLPRLAPLEPRLDSYTRKDHRHAGPLPQRKFVPEDKHAEEHGEELARDCDHHKSEGTEVGDGLEDEDLPETAESRVGSERGEGGGVGRDEAERLEQDGRGERAGEGGEGEGEGGEGGVRGVTRWGEVGGEGGEEGEWVRGKGEEDGGGEEGELERGHDEHHLLPGVARVQGEDLVLCRVGEAVDEEAGVSGAGRGRLT